MEAGCITGDRINGLVDGVCGTWWCSGSRGSGDALLWQSELRLHAGGEYSIAVLQVSSATYVGFYDGHGGPEASNVETTRRRRVFDRGAATLSTDHNVAVEEVRKEVKVIFDAYLKRKLA
ncbi:hypothetical protein YC2023_017882 [Brassica napus]|uniref:Uncharacterized protein n=2 Tax=Brassica oleracea TaxID=3712 RepID=A0A0D3EFV4_BRAOL|nr:unnamed protein product [Brassica oleracea]